MSDNRVYAEPDLLDALVASHLPPAAVLLGVGTTGAARSMVFDANNAGHGCLLVDESDGTSVLVFGRQTVALRQVAVHLAARRWEAVLVPVVPDLLRGAYVGKPGIESRESNLRLLSTLAFPPAETHHICRRCLTAVPVACAVRKLIPGRYASWYWVCNSCDDGPMQPPVCSRPPTPPEAEAIAGAVASGYRFIREHRIEKFSFDFYFPRLRLLIEVDGLSWHAGRRRKKRDRAKTALAVSQGYKVVRLARPDVAGKVRAAVDLRAAETTSRQA